MITRALVASALLLLAGCEATLPTCPIASAQVITDGRGVFAAFDMDNLQIFKLSTELHAQGKCRHEEAK